MEVSALGFGVMGMNYNRGPHPDRKAMIALLHQAVEHGVTLFDTAQVYGPLINEELAGEALYPYRNRVSVTTKFGHSIVDGTYRTGELNSRPENIRRVAEESLRRLRVEVIDLFYQHRPIEDVAGTVRDLIQQGQGEAVRPVRGRSANDPPSQCCPAGDRRSKRIPPDVAATGEGGLSGA